jgi:hypothetical protein
MKRRLEVKWWEQPVRLVYKLICHKGDALYFFIEWIAALETEGDFKVFV